MSYARKAHGKTEPSRIFGQRRRHRRRGSAVYIVSIRLLRWSEFLKGRLSLRWETSTQAQVAACGMTLYIEDARIISNSYFNPPPFFFFFYSSCPLYFSNQNQQDTSNLLTTNWGTNVHDASDSLKAGPRGPTLMQDFAFREKLQHFDHERVPERVVHARGYGIRGYFQVSEE